MIDLSIVIVNYNLTQELSKCIVTLDECIRDLDYEIIIVDNSSSEPLFKKFKRDSSKRENLTLLCLPENRGFGSACNIGAREARGEYICFLNPDTHVDEDIFPPLISALKADDRVAICGPNFNGPRFFDFSAGFQPNLLVEALNVIYVGRLLEALIVGLWGRYGKRDRLEVGWVLGACMVMRSSLFNRLSGFDTEYFLFFEEVDLCRRALGIGYKVAYFPRVSISHIGSVSAKRDYFSFTRYFYSSKRLFFKKHFRGPARIVMLAVVKAQSVAQLMLWSALFLTSKEKARQKIAAHWSLLIAAP